MKKQDWICLVLCAAMIAFFCIIAISWMTQQDYNNVQAYNNVIEINWEPRRVTENLYYFDMDEVPIGEESETFQRRLEWFLRKQQNSGLHVASVHIEKTHPIGINGYYVTVTQK